MLSLVSGSAVQLRNLIAVHIHQLCHRQTGQQSLEAIVRAGGGLTVLVLQGGDLIQIRLCALRRQGTEVSRAAAPTAIAPVSTVQSIAFPILFIEILLPFIRRLCLFLIVRQRSVCVNCT